MKIEFSTDSDAFCDDNGNPNDDIMREEIVDILNGIIFEVRYNKRMSHGSIRDINGNKIGEWSL